MICLCKYHQRWDKDEQPVHVNMVISEDEDGTPCGVDAADGSGEAEQRVHPLGEFCIGQQLTAAQRQEMEQLLARCGGDVFNDSPGTTHLTEHHVRLTDEVPCYQLAYRVPEAMRDAVERELMRMLDSGIIQYDYETNYNLPTVIVKKANGGLRICNNFIELNKKTVNQQYLKTDPNTLKVLWPRPKWSFPWRHAWLRLLFYVFLQSCFLVAFKAVKITLIE